MSAQTVTSKIEEKARLAAEEIIAEAKDKAEADKKAILDEAAQKAQKLLDAAAKNAEIAEKGRRQTDNMNRKLAVLSTKRELLADARKEAKEMLLKMNEKAFCEIFAKYVAESELSGEFELIPSPLHKPYCQKASGEFEKAGNIKLTVSDKTADIDSGFMLSCEDYEIEFSLDVILDEVFEKNEKAIADILFE